MTTNPHTIVLSTENCRQCNATYRALDEAGADYEVLDGRAPENADLLERIREKHDGATQAPFVIVNHNLEKSWYGFRPDLVKLHSAPTEGAAA